MKSIVFKSGSLLWSGLNRLAEDGLRRGWIRPRKLPARVVSVGNIQAGGAGKTPLVARIAREASSRGLVVVILCRGYGGAWEVKGGVLAPGVATPPANLCGDEAALLHELVPEAWIGIGADRWRSFESCARDVAAQGVHERRIDLVILDDGFQHRKIQKDVEVVALTSRASGEAFFRESARALARAHLLVWTKGEREPAGLRVSGIPFVRARYRLPERPFKEAVCLVTGLGDGRAAREDLEKSGYEIRRHIEFPDHARYDARQIDGLLKSATSEGLRLVVTGKDWVKWRELGVRRGAGPGEIFVVEPELVFEEGQENWERVLWANG